MKRLSTVIALVLCTGVLAVPALADDGAPNEPKADGGQRGFSCEHAKARVAQLEGWIAKLQARIDAGKAPRPEAAKRMVKRWQERADAISARIAQRCSASTSSPSSTGESGTS